MSSTSTSSIPTTSGQLSDPVIIPTSLTSTSIPSAKSAVSGPATTSDTAAAVTPTSAPTSPITASSPSASATTAISSVSSSITSSESGNNTETVSSVPSTTSSAGETATSAAVASQTSPPASSSPNTAASAVGGVLGALLVLALICIAFLLFRRRRTRHASSVQDKGEPSDEMALINLDGTISNLTSRLKQSDARLRDAQAALLAQRRQAGLLTIDDKTVHDRFANLNRRINEWVLTHLKHGRPAAPPPGVIAYLQATQPEYAQLLHNNRTRYFVLRAVVGDLLAEAFATGEIVGSEQFFGMRNYLSRTASYKDLSAWQSVTMNLLEQDPSYGASRSLAIESIAKRIDEYASSVVGVSYFERRVQHIRDIVKAASDLAVELAKQSVIFKFQRPNSPVFTAVNMDDVQQAVSSIHLEGQRIQCVVFPEVLRFGDESGDNFERQVVVLKALVLTSKTAAQVEEADESIVKESSIQ